MKRILTVKETLGKLRKTTFTEKQFELMGQKLPNFYAQVTLNKAWSNYGQFNDTITLFKDGKN